MRLLDTRLNRVTRTLKLVEIHDKIPEYAILSHRWEDNEVSFENVEGLPYHLKGYHKVKRFCKVARKNGYRYVWVDTCCIDKKSSAELNEAINSMYKWYQRAAVCYVYLFDVNNKDDLPKSSWFTRGWTLQELLAPTEILFFNKEWDLIGSRSELAAIIEDVTNVPQIALHKFRSDDFCIAKKMSWSANRNTTREEDRAYCLLGIFNVNMPLLYGEGEKAFQRLQEEIMRIDTDLSLFLWQGDSCANFGMLAANPSCFSNLPDRLKYPHFQSVSKLSKGWDTNNAGMRLSAGFGPYALTSDFEEIYVLYLHEPYSFDTFLGFGIFVERKDRSREDSSYRRVTVNGKTWFDAIYSPVVHLLPFTQTIRQVFIAREPLEDHEVYGDRGFDLQFNSRVLCTCVCRQRPVHDPESHFHKWPAVQASSLGSLKCSLPIEPIHAKGIIGHLVITVTKKVDLLLCIGFDHSFLPICVVIPFSKQLYQNGLRAWNVLRAYYELLPDDTQGGTVLDPASHITALCGSDGVLEYITPDGDLTLDINDYDGTNGKHAVKIDFDAATFMQRYVSGLEDVDAERFDAILIGAIGPLLKIESAQKDMLVLPR